MAERSKAVVLKTIDGNTSGGSNPSLSVAKEQAMDLSGSNVRDPENRSSSKLCVCGGHNMTNAKSNKHHNSTKKKLEIRKKRKSKRVGAREAKGVWL